MIHRALFGSVERFFGVLVEHYAGAFPAWLAPVQVVVLPVADRHDAYAAEVAAHLTESGIRTELVDGSGGSLGNRIRRAKHQEKVPYTLVVGDTDVEHRTIGVNARDAEGVERDVPLDEFLLRLLDEVRERRTA
jgi:threonyl-tRNA synthetase